MAETEATTLPTQIPTRIAGLTVMPATAGLLLSFAWLAWPARRR
jgi:hypothetical protein